MYNTVTFYSSVVSEAALHRIRDALHVMDVTKTEKLEELDRLLQSRALHGSESLRAFLKFVVLKSVESQNSYLKEYIKATEVFGRSSDYDSRNDSMVRVQAGRLRSKLQEYYSGEGKDDRVIIDLPKGQYSPVFSYVPELNGSKAIPIPAIDGGLAAGTAAPTDTTVRLKVIIAALAIICFAISIVAFNYRGEVRRLRENPSSRTTESAEAQAAAPLWGELLRSPEPVLVAFSNTQFEGTAETGMRLLKPLDSSGSFAATHAQSSGNEARNSVVTDHYTGIGEVMGVYSLADFFLKAGHSFRVKRSLLLTWDDVKTENLVVLGSPAENLLLRDLPQAQDFLFRLMKNEKQEVSFGIANTKPGPGEQGAYFAKQEGPSRSQISEDYAVISSLKGLNENYRLLILAGITTFGTQAAAEYVTKPEYVKDLIAHLSTSSDGQPKLPSYFQILIKVKVNGGVPVQMQYVTHHVL